MLQKFSLLALAGASGTLARYGLANAVQQVYKTSSMWGTVVVNITGCFIAGILVALFAQRWPMSNEARLMILVGFMGAFTTFSAFIVETGDLVQSSQWMHAMSNVALQNGLGILALFTGMMIGRVF